MTMKMRVMMKRIFYVKRMKMSLLIAGFVRSNQWFQLMMMQSFTAVMRRRTMVLRIKLGWEEER